MKTKGSALADRRAVLWTARGHEQERLAWHRLELSTICGCTTCGDADRRERLGDLIIVCLGRIAELDDQICG